MTANEQHNPSPEPLRWPELIAGYVLGDLSSEEMAQVQQYLATHPEAQAEAIELQTALNLLPLSLPEDDAPPVSLRDKLLQDAAGTPQQSQPVERMAQAQSALEAPIPHRVSPSAQRPTEKITEKPKVRLRARSPFPFPLGFSAIAAAAIAAFFGWQNLQLRSQLQFAQQQSEQLAAIKAQLATAQADVAEYQEVISMLRLPENRLLALSGASGFTETSSGSVVIAPQKSWAMLTLKDLPEPPAGKAYQLWAMANGEKVYCVEFKPDETGQVLVEIPVGNWAGTPMVSVTLEDEGTIPTETSEMVMNGAVI